MYETSTKSIAMLTDSTFAFGIWSLVSLSLRFPCITHSISELKAGITRLIALVTTCHEMSQKREAFFVLPCGSCQCAQPPTYYFLFFLFSLSFTLPLCFSLSFLSRVCTLVNFFFCFSTMHARGRKNGAKKYELERFFAEQIAV